MRRYKIDSMKYDQRVNGNGGAATFGMMNDWTRAYETTSPPSSRYGEDDTSSVTQSRPRRSRLDNDIAPPRCPAIVQPIRPASGKSSKVGNGGIHNGGSRGHNSTFNGYEHHNYNRNYYNSSRGPNETFSGLYPPSRQVSGYTSDFMNSRGVVGMLPNKMREPRRPRSTAAEKYTNNVSNNGRSGFGGYESGEFSTSEEGRNQRQRDSEENSEDEDEVEEEDMRNYYLEARRAQGSRSVTNNFSSNTFNGDDDKYYYGVVHLNAQRVDHVLRTMPPPEEYFNLKPIERVGYLFYCAVYQKPYRNVLEFHKIFNREYYKFVCAGDSDDAALFKICRGIQDRFQAKQLEESRKAYEKAQQAAAENEKLDYNQHRIVDQEDQMTISKPDEVLGNGPLHYHKCLQFATIGVGGKLVIVRPAGTVDPMSGNVLSTASVHVDDLKSLLYSDDQSSKVIESVQNFKGPLIAGQTPTHSVRLYIQRQIDALRRIRDDGKVKKSEVMDALLIWQLLEIMVQQHGRVTGPDVATLLTNASEELLEKTGIAESAASEPIHKAEAKERFNKFLLGGHINEAVESAISDGLYADAMTLIRRLHPNDAKKIEEIETRFMNLRSVDDPFATLVSVASNQPPPILTNTAFDDDNNWKRHAAIVLANLSSPTAMHTVYNLGLLLAKRERHCAADFCLLVTCVLAGYDPFFPLGHAEGEEKSRKHIGLVHSGTHLLNLVDGLSGTAGFSFTDLHATDIFDYALRLGNNNAHTPLAKSVDYQCARIEYAKKLSSYGGFATDSFRYCTEVASSLWMYISEFDKNTLLNLCDLADSLQYVAATTSAEIEWIGTLRMMVEGGVPPAPAQVAEQVPVEQHSLTSEAREWHNEHQAPIEIAKKIVQQQQIEHLPVAQSHLAPQAYQQPQQLPSISPPQPAAAPVPPDQPSESSESYETTVGSTETDRSTSVAASTSRASTVPEPSRPPPKKTEQQPGFTAPPLAVYRSVSETKAPSDFYNPISTPTPEPYLPTPSAPTQSQPIPIANEMAADVAKSPRSELDDIWGSGSPAAPPAPMMHNTMPTMPPMPAAPLPSAPVLQHPSLTNKPSIPNTRTAPPPASEKQAAPLQNEQRKTSKGWFGAITEKVMKSIPSSNQMILPDDKKPSIIWDDKLKKYVGTGVEEEVVAPPPPVMSVPHLMGGGPDSNKSSTNSLRNARSGVGSRYLQSGMTTSQVPAMDTGMPSMMPPTMMPLPTSFGFIPTDTDDSSEFVDPFSREANPSISSETGTEDAQ
ncbi:unnamed protein product [Caenorhabditis sp. 36 PRJEB53466]|nr:unnamed protein product [Caenorhabditis sp. 36 PRJEB53466]